MNANNCWREETPSHESSSLACQSRGQPWPMWRGLLGDTADPVSYFSKPDKLTGSQSWLRYNCFFGLSSVPRKVRHTSQTRKLALGSKERKQESVGRKSLKGELISSHCCEVVTHSRLREVFESLTVNKAAWILTTGFLVCTKLLPVCADCRVLSACPERRTSVLHQQASPKVQHASEKKNKQFPQVSNHS